MVSLCVCREGGLGGGRGGVFLVKKEKEEQHLLTCVPGATSAPSSGIAGNVEPGCSSTFYEANKKGGRENIHVKSGCSFIFYLI